MNILYIVYAYESHRPDSGSGQRTLFLEKALEAVGNVYICSLVYDKHMEGQSADGRRKTIVIENRRSLLYVINHFVTKYFHVLRFHPRGIGDEIGKAFPGVKFDAVVCRYALMAAYAKPWKIAPVYIDVDDLPIEFFRTIVAPRWGASARVGEQIVKQWQAAVFSKAKGLWIANPEHLAQMPKGKGAWLPNLPPRVERTCNRSSKRDSIMTVASFAHAPNVEGVARFLEKVWPVFHAKYPQIRYRVVGRGIPESFKGHDGVDVLGFVEDILPEYERAYFSVVPIYSGSGTCIKTLESMTYGRVALCSRFGARGIDERLVGHGIERSESAQEMIAQACRLVDDDAYREELESEVPRLVSALYSFESFQEQVSGLLLS